MKKLFFFLIVNFYFFTGAYLLDKGESYATATVLMAMGFLILILGSTEGDYL